MIAGLRMGNLDQQTFATVDLHVVIDLNRAFLMGKIALPFFDRLTEQIL